MMHLIRCYGNKAPPTQYFWPVACSVTISYNLSEYSLLCLPCFLIPICYVVFVCYSTECLPVLLVCLMSKT